MILTKAEIKKLMLSLYDITEEKSEEILKVNKIHENYFTSCSHSLMKARIRGMLISHFRHISTRYQKALKGCHGKKYIRIKQKYSLQATAIVNRIRKSEPPQNFR